MEGVLYRETIQDCRETGSDEPTILWLTQEANMIVLWVDGYNGMKVIAACSQYSKWGFLRRAVNWRTDEDFAPSIESYMVEITKAVSNVIAKVEGR